MALTKLSTDSIDLSGNTTALTIPSGTTDDIGLEYLVVGGGGAGNYGGGGAGGYLTNVGGTIRPMTSPAVYTITVGAGGTLGASGNKAGNSGGQSIISESGSAFATVDGGGGGGGADGSTGAQAKDGGSGGGGGYSPTGAGSASGVGTGNAGGTGSTAYYGGGGGGAGAAGNDSSVDGNGGDGLQNNITGTNLYYAGGGGAMKNGTPIPQGGQGGGGTGANGQVAVSGTQGTDGLGGGGGARTVGGTGVVILRTNVATATNSGLTVNGSTSTTINGIATGSKYYYKVTAGNGGTLTFAFSNSNTGRPSPATEGILRDNTTTGFLEFYNGSIWKKIRGTLVRACTTSTCNYPTTASALYQFNDNINDTFGSYNGVSSSNITYAAGKYGNAAQLNGSSSNIFLPNNSNFDLSASQSMSFWVYSTNSGNAWLFQKGNPESYGLWTNGSIFYFTLYTPGYSALTTSTITLSTWYHVVLTVDAAGTGYILYLNGAVADSNTFGAINTNTSDVRIGSYQGGSLFWNGAIDQLRYFNTTLSSSQVIELYNEVGC